MKTSHEIPFRHFRSFYAIFVSRPDPTLKPKLRPQFKNILTHQDCFQIHLHMDILLNHFQKVVLVSVWQGYHNDSFPKFFFIPVLVFGVNQIQPYQEPLISTLSIISEIHEKNPTQFHPNPNWNYPVPNPTHFLFQKFPTLPIKSWNFPWSQPNPFSIRRFTLLLWLFPHRPESKTKPYLAHMNWYACTCSSPFPACDYYRYPFRLFVRVK